MRWIDRHLLVLLLVAAAGCAPARPGAEARIAWTRACVRLAGCAPFAGLERPYAECMQRLVHRPDVRSAECIAAARTCEDAAACVGLTSPEDCGDYSRCDGDVLHACQNGRRVAGGGWRNIALQRDCGAEGLHCRVIYPTYASTDYHYAACVAPGSCTVDTCDGDRLVQCDLANVADPGVPIPWDCVDGVCSDGECRGDGGPCEPGSWCEGDVAVSCIGGRLLRETCAPGTCSPDFIDVRYMDNSTRCHARGECEPRCEGSHAVRCVEGHVERYDCRAWGFETCEVLDDAGYREAHCR